MSRAQPDRRNVLFGSLAGVVATGLPGRIEAGLIPSLTIDDTGPGRPISPLIYGSNEIGVMDGGLASAVLDAAAGVTARRLGGDLMTGYNWLNNACHAGKNHHHSNGPFLLEALQVPASDWDRPAAVIETMHAASLAIGAKSLVTLPLSPYLAADRLGRVGEAEATPSPRFVPANWSLTDVPGTVSLPRLVAHLAERYGSSASPGGIHGYALDNEPGIWHQTHPRLFPGRLQILAFIDRSIAAARAIKTIDPSARVFGPSSWGATEFVTFQNAPDWPRHRAYGSFLGLYLDSFRRASEQDGRRLLDALDIHWYAFLEKGGLFRSEDPAHDQARLDAPRSLSEPGFVEQSWVPRALAQSGGALSLPLLPSLHRLIDRWFPGTALAITEFNYGGAGQLTSGLALADALGRFATGGGAMATHWGSLPGWLGEAYRLYRQADPAGRRFGDRALELSTLGAAEVSAYAASDAAGLALILINRSQRPVVLDIGLASGRAFAPGTMLGFDAGTGPTRPLMPETTPQQGGWRLLLPPLAARRLRLNLALARF